VLPLLRRQHQDRSSDPLQTELATHGVAVEAGQQDVEDDRRVRPFSGAPQPVRPAVGEVDLEPLRPQSSRHGLGESDLVLDDQYAHGPGV
jgi:hypothetical protein